MTTTNEKLRSLFLAALMVFSVIGGTVAFSGAAAAANSAGNSAASVTPDTVPAGDTVTHTFEYRVTEVQSDGNTDDFIVTLSTGSFANTPIDITVTSENGDDIQIDDVSLADDGGTNNQAIINISPSTSDTQDSTPNLTLKFNADVNHDGTTGTTNADFEFLDSGGADTGPDTVEITRESSDAGDLTNSDTTTRGIVTEVARLQSGVGTAGDVADNSNQNVSYVNVSLDGPQSTGITTSDIEHVNVELYNSTSGVLVAENRTVNYNDNTEYIDFNGTAANSTSDVNLVVVTAKTSGSISDGDDIDAEVEAVDADGANVNQIVVGDSLYNTGGVQTAVVDDDGRGPGVVSAFVNSDTSTFEEDANVTIIKVRPDGTRVELNPDDPLITDSQGNTLPLRVPLGTYRARATKGGFTTEQSAQVTLTQADNNRQLDVTLEATAEPKRIELDTVGDNRAPADGVTPVTIEATVFGDVGDQTNVPLENVDVELDDDGNRVEVAPGTDGNLGSDDIATNTTDSDGKVRFTARSDEVQVTDLTAVAVQNRSVNDTIQVRFGVLSGDGNIPGQVFAEDIGEGTSDARVWATTNESFYDDVQEVSAYDTDDEDLTPGGPGDNNPTNVNSDKDYFRIINSTTGEVVSVDDYRVQRGTGYDTDPSPLDDEDNQTTSNVRIGNIEFLNETDKGVGSGFFVDDDGTSASFSIVMLEAGNYTLQASEKAPNASREPTEPDTASEQFSNVSVDGQLGDEFTTDANLTYERAEEDSQPYDDGGPVLTDVTDEDGDYQLRKLYTDNQNGQYYIVIADKAAYSTEFGDVLVQENGYDFEDQDDEILSLKPREVTPVVNITNFGFGANESAVQNGAITEFQNKSDEFNQTIRRDGQFVDVINVNTTAENSDDPVNATVTLEVPDDYFGPDTDEDSASESNFDGEFINVAGPDVSNVQYDNANDTVTFNTGASGTAQVWLEADRSTETLFPDGFANPENERTRIEASVANNARGGDVTYKRFLGITQTASIRGDISDGSNGPVSNAEVWISNFDLNTAVGGPATDPVTIEKINESYYEVSLLNDSRIVQDSAVVQEDELRSYNFSDFNSSQRQEWGLVTPAGVSGFTLYTTSAPQAAVSEEGAAYELPRVPAKSVDRQYLIRAESPSGELGNGTAETRTGFTDDADISIVGATEENFAVSDLNPQNVSVGVNGTFSVEANITNNGDTVGVANPELVIGGTVFDTTQTASLSQGETETVTLVGDTTGLAEGNYTFTVQTDDSSQSGNLTIAGANPPNLQVSNVSANPSTINQSENLTIESDVTNIGGQGSGPVTVELNGTNVSSGAGQVDIVFLIDTSTSMSQEINGIQNGLTTFTNNLESQGIDVRYAVVTFADQQPYNLRQGYTSDVSQTQQTLNNIQLQGFTERSYDAINGSIDDLNARPGADEYFLTFTDEDSDVEPSTPSQSELANRLDSEDISLFAISPGDNGVTFPDQGVGSLANSTQNGQFFDIAEGNFSAKFENEISGQIANQSGGQTVTLNSNETTSVSFTFGSNDTSNLAPGNYNVTVSTANDTGTTNVTVQSGTQSIVDQYDSNNDGAIQPGEAQQAIADLNNGVISPAEAQQIIAALNA